MRPMLSTGMLAVVLLGKQVLAGPRHGHFHKRDLVVVTDLDIVTDVITDIVWVTVTGDDGATTTTTTPAVPVAVVSTTSVVVASSAPVAAAANSPAPAVTPSSVAAPAPVSSVAAPAVSSPAPVSSVAAPAPSSVAPVQTTLSTVAVASAPSSAAAPIASTASASSSSKRGLSYNDISLLSLFEGSSTINWCYNWASTSQGTVPSGFEFIPMLWGLEAWATDSFSANVKAAIASGSTAVLAMNEPDNPGQSNLTPSEAAAGYLQYIQPLSGSAQLGAPAVTNGAAPEGLAWLEDFITACTGCDIDFVPIHWYDSATNFAYFKEYVQQAYVAGGNRTLWITEFGATGSDAEVSNFLEVVMPWLDEQEYVGRYAYFMDEVGVLAASTNALSQIGSTFADYTSSLVSSLIADV